MKPIIDEFENKLKEFKAKGDEVQDIEAKAISAVKKGGRRGGRKAGSALAGLKVKGVPSGSSPQKKVCVCDLGSSIKSRDLIHFRVVVYYL